MNQPKLTLSMLYAFWDSLLQIYRDGEDVLIIPYDDGLCGRLLERLEQQTGINFPDAGHFSEYIQDVLDCRIVNSSNFGIVWRMPARPTE